MSTELATQIPTFLKPATQEQLAEQEELITSVNSLFPRCRMSKEGGFVIDLDEQVLDKPITMFIVVLGARNIYASRSLYEPVDDGELVCGTGLMGSGKASLREAEGRWRMPLDHEVYRSPSGEECVRCAKCEWGRFGSEPDWDENKAEAKGKACKDRRVLFALVMKPIQGTKMYETATDTPIRLILPSSSVKVASSLAAKASLSGLLLQTAVFRINTLPKGEGMIKWSELSAELVGFVNEETYNKIHGFDHQPIMQNVHKLVTEQAGNESEELYSDTQVNEF